MTIIIPEGTPSLGNVKTSLVSAIAALATPKLTEITAAAPASLEITGYLQARGYKPDQDVSRGVPPRRLHQRTQFERFNTTTQKIDDLMYVINPQAAAASDGKKAYEALTPGLKAFFVERHGLDAEVVPWTVGDWVNILPITLGPRIILSEEDENGDVFVKQAVSIRAARKDNVQIVAGP